jgi:hypothetical protein
MKPSITIPPVAMPHGWPLPRIPRRAAPCITGKTFLGLSIDQAEVWTAIRPHQVAAWRDDLRARILTNSSIRRKMTVLRSLFFDLRTSERGTGTFLNQLGVTQLAFRPVSPAER